METEQSTPHSVSPTQIAPIQRLSAPGAAAQSIRAGIMTGRLKPGDRLVEQEVARSLGIGQPTVREALKELEYQGLVRKSPNRGTYVTKLSPADYEKIAEVRNVLEAMAIERAARNLSTESEHELREIINQMAAAVEATDLPAFHQTDIAFHRKIWSLAGNEYLAKALEGLVLQLFVFATVTLGNLDSFKSAVTQHQAILDALCSRDGDVARRVFVSETVRLWSDAFSQMAS